MNSETPLDIAVGTVIGIDIGGSKSHGIRVTAGRVEREAFSRSANIASVGSVEATRQLDRLLDDLGRSGIDSVCAGAAGADGADAENWLFDLLQKRFPDIPVRVVHDTRLVLAAAGLDVGVVGISGTGCAAWGRSADGTEVRAGGWGYLLGDEGSAYGVTRAALQLVLHRVDQGLAADPLTTAMLAACAVDTPGRLLNLFYRTPSRREWAARASVVFDLAGEGEPACSDIVAGAAADLVRTIVRVCRRLELMGPVVLAGGLIVHQPLLQEAVRTGLARLGVQDMRVLVDAPVLGAATLATALLAHR